RLNDGELLQALEAIQAVGGFPVVHAENWDVICNLIARNLATGRTEPRWHPRSRPAILEGEAAGRVIDLATLASSPLHIFHVSCGEVVERIADARRRGLPITGETCPQYLLLTDDLYDRPGIEGTLPVCAPPLRTEADQTQLWNALKQNHLQIVTTDHCPFNRADKAKGLTDFSRIPGGVPSIEGRLSMIFSHGVKTGHITLNQWVDSCCTTPAKLFQLDRKGVIAPGYDADLVVFDPHQECTLSTETLHEAADWTPYEGLKVTGWPSLTISRGQIITEGEICHAVAGQGRFLKRQLL
ncbi:MAG: amidohydrolase family protein, partial [Chloroflexota bacterium]